LRDDGSGSRDLAGDLRIQKLTDAGVEIGDRVNSQIELYAMVDLRICRNRDLRIASRLTPIIGSVAAGRKDVLIELRWNFRLP
jgi:hypothetical protein